MDLTLRVNTLITRVLIVRLWETHLGSVKRRFVIVCSPKLQHSILYTGCMYEIQYFQTTAPLHHLYFQNSETENFYILYIGTYIGIKRNVQIYIIRKDISTKLFSVFQYPICLLYLPFYNPLQDGPSVTDKLDVLKFYTSYSSDGELVYFKVVWFVISILKSNKFI